jgi:hypothetical protein
LGKNVKWNISVYVEEGPSLVSSEQIITDAVDAIAVELKGGATDEKVLVQPSSLANIKFICIKSDTYEKISYKFSEESGDSEEIPLDKAHFLTSSSLIKLFKKAPKTIKFTNKNPANVKPAKIDIVIARETDVEVSP